MLRERGREVEVEASESDGREFDGGQRGEERQRIGEREHRGEPDWNRVLLCDSDVSSSDLSASIGVVCNKVEKEKAASRSA